MNTSMRYEVVDGRGEILRLKIETLDDLWVLYTLLREGDVVRMRTVREIKQGDKGGSSRRLPMTLSIKLKNMEFQPFTNRLRLRGVIVEGPERFGLKGSHHTFSVDIGSELTVYREGGWGKRELKRLEKSRRLGGSVVIVAIDYDEVGIGVLRSQGLKIVMERSLSLPGKDSEHREQALREELASISKIVLELLEREEAKSIVVGGPGFLKDMLASQLSSMNTKLKVIVDHASMGGAAGVRELVRRGLPQREIRDEELREADKALDEAVMWLSKDPRMVGVGLEECMKAALYKAIKELLVIDELLSIVNAEQRRAVEEVLDNAEEGRATIRIVPSSTPTGERLAGLGGIVCILRFPLEEGEDE